MKNKRSSKSGGFNPRFLLAFLLCSAGFWLAVFSVARPTPSTGRVASVPASPLDVPMPLSIKRPIAATMDWFAAFTNPNATRRPGAMRAASGVGGKSSFAPAALTPLVSQAVTPHLSLPVRDLPLTNPNTISTGRREEGELSNRTPQLPRNPLERDPVIQSTTAPTVGMPPVGASFEGLNITSACGSCLPPDTVGAVGPNHYVQMVNEHFAIYSKAGAILQAPRAINTLFSVVPNSTCATHNNGDPIVIYDQLADRWLLSQFTVQSGTENYAECIAISTSPDPTGTYYLYQFDESADTFHDYPHIGVWPDGYYMSTNLFPNSALLFSTGAGAWAFDRQKMLAGQPAKFVYFDETPLATQTYTPGGQQPTSVDGKNPPPAGAPNYFVEVDNTNTPNTPPATGLHDEMHIWKFHVDWNNPANSTFGIGSSAPAPKTGFLGSAGNAGQPNFILPIADFLASTCQIENGPNDCTPQKATSGQPPEYLDVLGDRLMFRVTYRNFGDHESLLVSHTVDAQADQPMGVSRNGVRWYEVRNPSAATSVYQQGTFAPLDPTSTDGPLWRWMGSAAMDHSGDIAIGYSASGPNYFPSLHYAGRLAGDPLNELTQGEAVMFVGQGIENNTGLFPFRNRWGDYSALTVDPTDDCTFWYTNEYLVSTPTDILPVDWHTRVGSFKFPQCTVPTPPLLSVSSRKVHAAAGTFDIPLPQTGTRGVECRSSGANGDFTIVFTFANPVVACGTSPNGTVQPGLTTTECVVQMSGVPNAQYATAALNGVVDDHANQGNVSATFGILLGDVNGSGRVDSGDVSLVRQQTLQTVVATNSRDDINTTGRIDAGDVSIARQQALTALPTPP